MNAWCFIVAAAASALAAIVFVRYHPARTQAYDPGWLVRAAQEQFPDDAELIAALNNCHAALSIGAHYIRFVDDKNPNTPGSRWQFSRNVMLEDTEHGDVILDVMRTGEVGGVELLTKKLQRDRQVRK